MEIVGEDGESDTFVSFRLVTAHWAVTSGARKEVNLQKLDL